MKRLLTVQDLSCVGKCSLTVALPVISAMGVEAAVLPTAVLSTHTAFPSPAVRDLTGDMEVISDHWKQIGVTFDGIYTGYLASVEQVERVLALRERFPCFLLVDPVMGDNGNLYSRIDEAFAGKMAQLCAVADAIVPNLTEACYLTGTPYPERYDEAFIRVLLKKLTAMGCPLVAITGVSFDGDTVGVMGYNRKTGEFYHYTHKKLPESYHGTGDIFTAVCAGAMVQGNSWEQALKQAADFVLRCMELTAAESRDKRYGVCFEKALPELMR